MQTSTPIQIDPAYRARVVEHLKELDGVELREYQVRVITRVLQAIDNGHRTILIELPTGSGKTIVGHALAKILHEERELSIGWTCMRRALVHQAARENRDKFNSLPISYFSTFCNKGDYPNVDILFEDEGQHSASSTATNMYAQINPKVHISMTATPYRTDRVKLCFSSVIKDAGTRALVDSGYLSKYHLYVESGDWTPENVAATYLEDPGNWGKSVIYFLTIQQCYECAEILSKAGVSVDVVHGGSNQDYQIEQFQRGRTQVLINVMVLTEGFDAPDLKTVFVRPSPNKGPVVQMAGRVLRKHPDKPYAQIVQNERSRWLFSKIASSEKRYKREDGKWLSQADKEGMMDAAAIKMVKVLMQTEETTLPKYVLKHRNRNKLRYQQQVRDEGGDVATEVATSEVNT